MMARTKKASHLRSDSLKYPLAKIFRIDFADEIAALVLLVGGVLYFLSLVSFVPGDLPAWVSFSTQFPPNDPAHNFIGPVGAVLAGFSYFLFGAASLALATAMIGLGAVKLFHTDFKVTTRLGWVVVFLFATACLAELQPWFFNDWSYKFQVMGAGGLAGKYLGRDLLHDNMFGSVGSWIFLLMTYFISLVLIAGLQPVELLRAARNTTGEWWEERMKALEERKRLQNDPSESASATPQKSSTSSRTPKSRKTPTKPEPVEDDQDLDEFAGTPEVEIIDTSVPQPRKEPADTQTEPDPEDAQPAGTDAKSGRKQSAKTASEENAGDINFQAHKFQHYRLPSLDQLEYHNREGHKAADPNELKQVQDTIIETLKQFNINVAPGNITKGPTITRYEVYPAKGVRVDKIVSLERDIARATRAEGIHILAPIPGKDTVGIEIANHKKVIVTLRELLEGDSWQQRKEGIPLALGKDVYGKTIVADLTKMPHLLVAGATGSGKSVCINSIIASIIYRYSPEELRFIMIDPKVVELQLFNRLPHMAVPVVTDPKKVLLALRWVINEMEKRYRIFAHCGVKNLAGFNARQEREEEKRKKAEEAEKATAAEQPGLFDENEDGDPVAAAPGEEEGGHGGKPQETLDGTPIPDRLPYIVVIIDELADLMQTAPADVESAIARITQMARAAGIHLIVATQTPRADVVTGVIKANIPCRIAFQVSSKIDSRVILDENGAERLLGQGDMFYLPPGTGRLMRAQGALVTEQEMGRIVDTVSEQAQPHFDVEIHEQLNKPTGAVEEEISDEDEELVEKCLEVIRQEKKASTSMLQRRLRLGYTRAARIVDILEERGILGPGEGAKPREILVDLDAADDLIVDEVESGV